MPSSPGRFRPAGSGAAWPQPRRGRPAVALFAAAALVAMAACADTGGSGDGPLRIYLGGDDYRDVVEYVTSHGLAGNVKLRLLDAGSDANAQVAAGRGDLAFYQTLPAFMAEQQASFGDKLSVASRVAVAPYALYSSKWKDLKETTSRINSSLVPDSVTGDSLPHGSKVVLPVSPAGFARGLYLLQSAGLLKLDRAFGGTTAQDLSITQANVLDTPRHISMFGTDLMRHAADAYRRVDAVILDPRTAIGIGLAPSKDALAMEPGPGNPYAHVLVAPARLAGDARVAELVRALESPQVAEHLAAKYNGAVIPAASPHDGKPL